MTNRDLRDAVTEQPFLPFRIRMTDGRMIEVKHPDFVMVHPGDRTFVFYDYDRRTYRIIDLLHTQEIEYDMPDSPEEQPVAEAA